MAQAQRTVNVTVGGLPPGAEVLDAGTAIVLTGDDPLDENSFADPLHVSATGILAGPTSLCPQDHVTQFICPHGCPIFSCVIAQSLQDRSFCQHRAFRLGTVASDFGVH